MDTLFGGRSTRCMWGTWSPRKRRPRRSRCGCGSCRRASSRSSAPPCGDAEQRVAMLDLAVADNPDSPSSASSSAAGASYTVLTLRALAAGRGEPVYVVIGADAAASCRSGTKWSLFPRSRISWSSPGRRGGAPAPADRRVIEVPAVDISATLVRERCARGGRFAISCLTPCGVRRGARLYR